MTTYRATCDSCTWTEKAFDAKTANDRLSAHHCTHPAADLPVAGRVAYESVIGRLDS